MHPSIYPSSSSSVLDAYSVRVMLGLVLSLTVVSTVLHIPTGDAPNRVGWGVASMERAPDHIMLSEIESESSEESVPGSVSDAPPPTSSTSSDPTPVAEPTPELSSQPAKTSQKKSSGTTDKESIIRRVAALEPDDQQPNVVGGMGNLYVNIEYPEKARKQGIQGELELEFTVHPDGSVSSVDVIKSLHPLCDSAAVEGVRSVTFVPAKHNGEPVPVRMKLPVRFRLINFPSTPSTAGQNP